MRAVPDRDCHRHHAVTTRAQAAPHLSLEVGRPGMSGWACPTFRAALFHIVGEPRWAIPSWPRMPPCTSRRRTTPLFSWPTLCARCASVTASDCWSRWPSHGGCAACMAAYSAARDALVAAGGVTQWLAQYETRVSG